MMNSRNSRYRKQILAAASLIGMVVVQNAAAQEQAAQTGAATEPQSAPRGEEIVVTGSRIAGTKITEALPVTVVGEDEIAATAAVSGDELLRSIPQMSDQSFNSSNGQTSSNFARGDAGSIDRTSTRLNSSHYCESRMPSSA